MDNNNNVEEDHQLEFDQQHSNEYYKNDGFEESIGYHPLIANESTASETKQFEKSPNLSQQDKSLEFNPILNDSLSVSTEDNDNPYLQLASKKDDDDLSKKPEYTVKKGDSLMKVAYMHNVSERSIKQLNNLMSGQLVPGQMLLLPLTAGNPHSKQRLPDPAGGLIPMNKNTNKQGYQLDGDSSDGHRQLGSFLQGFHNMGLGTRSQAEQPKQQEEENTPPSSNPLGMIGKIFDTYSSMTKQKQAEKDLNQSKSRGSSPNKARGNKEIDMNAISEERTDPSHRLSQPTYANFDLGDYILYNQDPKYQSTFGSTNIIESEEAYILKLEAFYMIKFEKVFGTAIVKKDRLIFEPQDPYDKNLIASGEKIYNQHLIENEHQIKISDYGGQIDFMDVIEINKMNLANEKAIVSDNNFIREAYKYNYFLQIVLTAVNGVTLKKNTSAGFDTQSSGAVLSGPDSTIVQRNDIPIANIYFKVSHYDKSDTNSYGEEILLTNQYQEQVVDKLTQELKTQIEICKKNGVSDESNSYVPYYDSIIDKHQKGYLNHVKMNPLIKARLQQHNTLINIINKKSSGGKNSSSSQSQPKQKKTNTWSNMLIGNSKTEHSQEDTATANASPSITDPSNMPKALEIKQEHASLIDSNMIEYMPKMSDTSAILTDLQISNLCAQFPSYMRNNDWKRVFRMDQDGCSLLTFFQKCREHETTIIVCQDEHGHKFGGYCCEAWRQSHRFFGNCQNWLFSFGNTMDIKVYHWQGGNEQFMYADDKSIGLGGSTVKGRFAFYLSSDLYRGSSSKTDTYDNDILSKNLDFKCYKLEVWGIMD